MYQDIFEALAVQTRLSAREQTASVKWQEIGCFFMKNYLEQLGKIKEAVIGHIKAIIELEDNNFIKFSSVSVNQKVNAMISGQPDSCREVDLTFNAIVAKVTEPDNLKCFHLALERTCSVYELVTDYREKGSSEGHGHNHDETCPGCHEGHHHED
ncbi:MAG: hypothetical protein AB7V37_11145 [Eubacteriaceae bacterium]|jgi:hypothetical protein|nr:hypothetical protein [Eubacteriaceae bacterium]MDK2961698.1 hypothetical protein [Eubacteriaceae bacterium]